MSMDNEWRRLQQLYAAMSDDELLALARDRAGLTEVAQQVVVAEMSSRKLELVEAEEPAGEALELDAVEGNPSLVELMTFQIASEAEQAMRLLDDAGIPVEVEQAMRQFTRDGPKVKTNWLTVVVERSRQQESVELLHEKMGLFPVMKPEEMEEPDGDDALFPVGTFDVEADAEAARKALSDAGIWFRAEKDSDDEAGWEGTLIEVRLKDEQRALEAIEAAFSETE
jgi:hypothetical protein